MPTLFFMLGWHSNRLATKNVLDMNIIIVQNIIKSYAQGKTKVAVLRGISAHFERPKSYAITGQSGSGKSTLMHILSYIDKPDSGSLFYDDQNVYKMPSRRQKPCWQAQVGLVFQLPYLIGELTVIENVMTKGLIAGKSTAACKEDAQHLLEMVGIPEKTHAKPATLSGGQQQRVAIARALFNKPAFLFADEPTGNLDEQTSTAIVDLLIQCQKEWRMGLIVSSHDTALTKRLDVHYHLKDGILQGA